MLLRWLNLNLKTPKFLFWFLLLKTALVYFRQGQFLISDKETKLYQVRVITYNKTYQCRLG
jgi:hypothetical protein